MAFTNWTELKAEVATLLNRSDLTANIPGFIRLAEAQMARQLESREDVGMTNISIGGETAQIPCDFRGVISFRVNGSPATPLEYVRPDRLDELGATAGGKPRCYTIVGKSFAFYPYPASGTTYTARLRYRRGFDTLGEDNPDNWVLDRSPDAYLYGAALQSAPFLKDDARLQIWERLFVSAVADINKEARRETMGSTLQTSSHGAGYDVGMDS